MKFIFRVLFLSLFLPLIASAQVTLQQQVAMAKQLIPSLKTITVICNVSDVQPTLREIKAAATAAGLELSVFDVKAFPELYKVFRSLPAKVDLVWMVPDTVAAGDKQARRFVEENCIRKKIPLIAYSEDVLHEGALLFMSAENNQPMFYMNKAVAGLIDFRVPAGMESKVTAME